ncbi:bifunctional diguanylate cyclase/phosphodiesterase [Clostridium botulinum]|uniref:Nitrogen fixation protein n=1 Tax=Clostridium botulinum TaxID=1491 RepID=A0A9Q1ZBB3_CLOBO|nr:bifunctional diguanylate cyclase/phosphodiesterase [Clostridium botulinum]AEB74796.1 nitrogen fixation positive activator, putative [Clostridium botulinum BKT015925]KEI00212.1 nitrogen fixation protein [Clostridium botulinum C/D str. Sp77]KEI04441.1 nitrogen fixation protein [Clostridium botulinum D str. 16868]KLU76243.1 nitrogen fixation protein [Clostridium botulinum V891]KOA74326.1 nitrogen fixation protein [Clostridium botulinum]
MRKEKEMGNKLQRDYGEYNLQHSHETSNLYCNEKFQFEYSVFSQIIEYSKESIVVLDKDLTVLYVNNTFLSIGQYSKQEVINKKIENISESNLNICKYIMKNIKNKGMWTGEVEYISSLGKTHFLSARVKVIRDKMKDKKYYIAIFEDITDLKRSQKSVNYLKEYDVLTGLCQKWVFIKKLKRRILELEGKNKLIGVITLGLDDFKFVNEAMGHVYGDKLLKNISIRLKSIDKTYILSRITGDEFGIIIPQCESVREIEYIVQRINEIFLKSFIIKQQEVFITASIGISIYPIDALNANDLIMNATSAQNYVKKNGKNNYKIYSKDINKSAYNRIEMIAMLRHAVDNKEFILHYQPQANLSSGNVIGVEALIRWNHPSIGLIYPDKFIPLAEKTGLIIPMGRWVISEACRQNKLWHDAGFKDLIVSINLSALQFEEKDLVDTIKNELIKANLPPKYLEIEITEGILMENTEQAIRTLCELKDIGVKIAIDDFGTGYSSLSYLKEFPIDRLKIDRSFISGIPREDNGAIANIIIELAKSLNLKVVAEGTETREHITFLKERNCDTIQGYYFSKPVSKDIFTEILKQGKTLYEGQNKVL